MISKKPLLLFLIVLVISLWQCQSSGEETALSKTQLILKPDSGIYYAKGFSVEYCVTYTHITIPDAKTKSSVSYFLYNDSLPAALNHQVLHAIKVPCRSVASLSSIYTAMLQAIGSSECIKGIDNADYSNSKELLQNVNDGKILELSKGPELDIEKTINLHPDVVFAFGMVNEEPAYKKWLNQQHIPLVLAHDHLEKSPLARAEWIKFFALFTGKRATADSLFKTIEYNYKRISALTANIPARPTVLCELKYGDVWYVPAGKSSVAQLIQDAGGDYIWKQDTSAGSLPLSFEEVYQKAHQANIWLNTSSASAISDILKQDKRYAQFDALKNKAVYHYIKHQNALGYSPYWETGILYPDRILNDLTLIFHPELNDSLKDFYYYKKLE